MPSAGSGLLPDEPGPPRPPCRRWWPRAAFRPGSTGRPRLHSAWIPLPHRHPERAAGRTSARAVHRTQVHSGPDPVQYHFGVDRTRSPPLRVVAPEVVLVMWKWLDALVETARPCSKCPVGMHPQGVPRCVRRCHAHVGPSGHQSTGPGQRLLLHVHRPARNEGPVEHLLGPLATVLPKGHAGPGPAHDRRAQTAPAMTIRERNTALES